MKKFESTTDFVDERVELMVSLLGENQSVRSARFLKPCLNWYDNPPRLLPHAFFSESATSRPLVASSIVFDDWPREEWNSWEEKLRSMYEQVWRDAGIVEAVKASTYQIEWSNDLIHGLAQKWYHETNSFIFPWGEATITLEDVMVCGGYSLLGSYAFTLTRDQDLKQMEQKLVQVKRNLTNIEDRSTEHLLWLKHFLEEQGELEHAVFLSLWLAKFVFSCVLSEPIFHIAVHLAKGTQIALAPAVLASIYRDLTLLKINIDEAVKYTTRKIAYMEVSLTASLQLVQIWASERFPLLHLNPKKTQNFPPIIAKWHRVKIINCHDVSLALDSSAKSFLWRPYRDFHSKCFNLGSRQYLESFARCLRHSELVGIDCVETYLPHRVAMQFGLDQDIPRWVDRCKKISPTIRWRIYDSPITNALLSIAADALSSTKEPGVTTKYLEWWKRSRHGTNHDSTPRSILEKLSHASSEVGFHSYCHRDQIGDPDQNYCLTDREDKKRSHSHESHFSVAHRVENLTKSERESKRAKADAEKDDVNGNFEEAHEGKHGDNGKKGEGIMNCTVDIPSPEPESMSERMPQASPQPRSPTDTDCRGDSGNDKTDSVAQSQRAVDYTDVSVAGGVEKLATSENLNKFAGPERAMEDRESENVIGSERAMEGQNGEGGEGSNPCAVDRKDSDFPKLEHWKLNWASRNDKCEGAMEGQNGEHGEGSNPRVADTKTSDIEGLEQWLLSWADKN